ncbi:hypothetical protein [Lentzea jiangxiensis]|nr:hypothetical protein [Lentzea jiangxiensis]
MDPNEGRERVLDRLRGGTVPLGTASTMDGIVDGARGVVSGSFRADIT